MSGGTQAHFNVATFNPKDVIDVESSTIVTVKVHNYTATDGTFRIDCSTTGQIRCSNPTPDDLMPLDAGGNYNGSVTIYGYGLGEGTVTVKLYGASSSSGNEVLDDTEVRSITVTGQPLVIQRIPLDSGIRSFSIPMQASFEQPVNLASVRVWMGTQEVTSSITKSAGGYSVSPNLGSGTYTWKTYACKSGVDRCEYAQTHFQQLGSTTWELDDSLPPPNGAGIVGILGGLPLPPDSLRGCPMEQSAPEIRLDQPSSFLSQPAGNGKPGGLVFMASVTMNDTVVIKTVTVDRSDTDPTTCADYGYLDREDFNWNYWTGIDSTDEFWSGYPFGDLAFGPMPDGALWPDPVYGFRWPAQLSGTLEPTPLWTSHLPKRRRRAEALTTPARVPDPGAIDTTTFRLYLNGTLIVSGGSATATGVHVDYVRRTGASVRIPNSSSLFYARVIGDTLANNGGWNELIATIGDSTEHRSSVRARFVHLPKGPAQHLALTPLASFLKRDMGECAAFGPFQCGETFLTQTIPGFVTRDRPRDLHLVYRSGSQRVPTILPIQMDVQRQNAAPDSLVVTPYEGGSVAGPVLHYAGTKGWVSGAGAMLLWENADESRVLSGLVDNTNATTPATIRRINVAVKAYYPDVTITDTVTQDIVQTSLMDSTTTRFGRGWQLADVSRLATGLFLGGDSATVLVAGDGSWSVFRFTGGKWTPPVGENTRLVHSASPDSGAYWKAYYDNGATVGYRADGWQVWTRDMLGNQTTFSYSTSTSSRITGIADPSGRAFVLNYSSGSRVQSIEVRRSSTGIATHVADLRYSSSCVSVCQLLKAITWNTAATSDTTGFTYKSDALGRAMVDSVISPRHQGSAPIVQRFLFDDSLHTPSGFTGPGTQSYANFRGALRRAAPRMAYGRDGQPLERLLFPNQVRGTLVDAGNHATDYQVDRFSAPSWVRLVSDGAVPGGFFIPSSAADDIRIIERDTLGRVTKIVHGDPVVTTPDSVMYTYDALNRVTMVRRSTLAYPKPVGVTLDTLTFAYDSVSVVAGGAWCSRLLWSKDALKVPTTMVYGTSGAAKCLPSKIIAPGADTTIFTYGTLAAGQFSATRPISVRDGNGLTSSVTYESATWNTSVVTAPGGPQTHVYYGTYGRPDSTVDPLGIVTRFRRDSLGRVLASKTGLGTSAPTTRTFYAKGGLVDSVQVYASADALTSLLTPIDTFVQTTRNFYSMTGQLDSVIGPGRRNTTGINRSRKQSWIRDPLGQPVYSFVGNGAYVGTLFDWQGRPYSKFLSAVGNGTAVDGERFAETGVQHAWDSLGVGMGRLSSAGQQYEFYYDNKGRLTDEIMHDEYLGDYRLLRRNGWSPVGQFTGDTVVFENGLATASRSLTYNRRGQRTGETDVVTVASGQQLSGDKGGAIQYVYDSLTARLTKMVHLVTTSTGASDTLATVSWLYDRGGRDTLRTLRIPGTGSVPVTRSTHYDSHGWPDHIVEKVGSTVRYSFSSPVFSPLGEIRTATETRRTNTGLVRFNYDSTSWTRRLLTTTDGANSNDFYQWAYDRFGNRTSELHIPPGGSNVTLHYTVGSDNRLLSQIDSVNPVTSYRRYLTDQAGQRLATLDHGTGVMGLWGVSTWTAAGQLYYSMTPETATGPYDLVWNWYDGSGRRFMTHLATSPDRGALARPDSTVGFRTYYVYDGNDVAFTLVRPSTGTTWRIQQRYVNTGLDENVAARLWLNGTPTSLALVTDRQGGYIMGVKPDGSEETRTGFYLRNAFGKMESGSTAASSMETHTGLGFAGAGTPTAAGGGYVYLRNRWYDPQTGRFLSQDPIGLAGGVNLYGYAGNNPASYSDPFGLASCPEEAGGDGKTERYDDCPKFSPGWFANRSATGQGNEVLNTIGGVLSILGRHLSVSGTAGTGTASVDAVGLAGGVPAGSLEGTENYPAASLPQLGASVNVTLGDIDDVGDQLNIGLGHHAGLTVNFSAKTGHPNGLVFNFGVATPQIPVTASRNTGDQLRLVPQIAPGLPGVTVKLP